MIEITNKAKCTGCNACQSVCPKSCISMKIDNEGFLYPIVNKELCVNCNLCEKICPIINKVDGQNEPIAYGAYSKDKNVRLQSSSGGIFTLLAESVINRGGIVFGACFDKEFNVIHDFASDINGLSKFRGSKYVQSKTSDTYIRAKEFLDEKRLVLFTGTPCQIGGLKAYLQKDYNNLICQDIICHGVPSPMVWQKYIEYRKDIAKSNIDNINFRDKSEGWQNFSMKIEFASGSSDVQLLRNDLMIKSFLKNVSLRPSCYACSFKTLNRQSDITLADFWGIENVMPKMNDDKGTSLVIINSQKGQTLFDLIKDDIIFENTDLQKAISFNSAAIKSVPINNNRKGFFEDIDRLQFDELVNKYCKENTKTKAKRLIKGILSKLK
ncbi:MAG: Coenzyme F420 hydrogenase/dehydrogenase, beta subunit C-terminal domain [Oscillospiraceae bacterium]